MKQRKYDDIQNKIKKILNKFAFNLGRLPSSNSAYCYSTLFDDLNKLCNPKSIMEIKRLKRLLKKRNRKVKELMEWIENIKIAYMKGDKYDPLN